MHKYLAILLMGLLLTGCAAYTATSGRVVIQDNNTAVEVRFNDRDRGIIESYYKTSGKKHKGPPSGLAKRDKLPPGLRSEALPYALEEKLSRLPSSYVRVRVGPDIVLMDGKTRVITDLMYGVAN